MDCNGSDCRIWIVTIPAKPHHVQDTPKKMPERNHITSPLQKSLGDVSCKRTKNAGDAAVMLPVGLMGGWSAKICHRAVWLLRSQKVLRRLLQISRNRRRASLQRETSMKRTRGIVAATYRGRFVRSSYFDLSSPIILFVSYWIVNMLTLFVWIADF